MRSDNDNLSREEERAQILAEAATVDRALAIRSLINGTDDVIATIFHHIQLHFGWTKSWGDLDFEQKSSVEQVFRHATAAYAEDHLEVPETVTEKLIWDMKKYVESEVKKQKEDRGLGV